MAAAGRADTAGGPSGGASARAGASGGGTSGRSSGSGGGDTADAGTPNGAGDTSGTGDSAGAGDTSGRGGAGAGGAGAGDTSRCNAASLAWRSANKTNYTSYPDPGSEECIKYNGCMWAGQFAACDSKESETWVAAHNIVAAFPDFDTLKLHDLCLRRGSSLTVVTVLDTCGDSDCGGCCTQNRGSADELIDVESYTDARWGVPDGAIEWADLGPTTSAGCN
jgi:hypothetical protein